MVGRGIVSMIIVSMIILMRRVGFTALLGQCSDGGFPQCTQHFRRRGARLRFRRLRLDGAVVGFGFAEVFGGVFEGLFGIDASFGDVVAAFAVEAEF
jgi:hypothetical protein